MSRLAYYARPLVPFDVTDKEHRRHYRNFLRDSSWGKCPVKFISIDDPGHDLTAIMQKQIVDYYMNKEFGKE